MHCPSPIRIVFLSTALAFTPVVNADAKLDDMVMDHVLPHFDRDARVLIKNSGARYISSNWNGETRTLVAVAEMDILRSPRFSSVALKSDSTTDIRGFKNDRVGELCQHSAAKLIRRFLEKYDVTIAFVYGEKHGSTDPVTVEVSHHDLSVCV